MAAPVIVQSDPLDGGNFASSPHTFSITAQSGLSAIVIITERGPVSPNTEKVSGVTVNGVAAEESVGADTGNSVLARMQFWTVYSPASGTYDVVVTHSGGAAWRCHGVAHQITGSLTSAMVRTATFATGASTTPSLNVSSATDDLVIDGLGHGDGDGQTATVGGGQTELENFIGNAGGGTNSSRVVSSSEPGAGTVTMSATLSASRDWKLGAISIMPSGAGSIGFDDADGPVGMIVQGSARQVRLF